MLPSLKQHPASRPKQPSADLPSLLQSQIELQTQSTHLQKLTLQKSQAQSSATLNILTQLLQEVIIIQREVKSECSGMAANLEKLVRVQIKVGKNTVEEMREMRREMGQRGRAVVEKGWGITEQFKVSVVPRANDGKDERILEGLVKQTQAKLEQLPKVQAEQQKDLKFEGTRERLQSDVSNVYVEAREQQIVIPVKSCENNPNPSSIDSIKETISGWVGKTYDALIKQSFNGYVKKQMQQSESKVFFCQNLMLNFLELLDYLQKQHSSIWQFHKDQLMHLYQKKAQQTLSYYLVKYPQKKKNFIDPSIRKAIRPCNYSQSPEFNTMVNLGCDMRYEPSGNYFSAIKKFINALISESSKHFVEFKSTMKEIFTFQKESGEKYQLENRIGMKFREGTPLYTEEEIKLRGIEIKTPEVLRVIMKWIEELQQIMNDPAKHLVRDAPFPNRVKTRIATVLPDEPSKTATKLLKKSKSSLGQWQRQNKKVITSVCKQLASYCSAVIKQFSNIAPTQIKKTLPAYAVAEVVAGTAVSNLNQLIHLINSTIKKALDMYKVKMTFEDLEFIPFNVSDLLRCKCQGTVSEVVQVVKKLQNNDKLKIIRIKDRLNTGTQDFLINVKMKNCQVICQVQVGFKTEANEKMGFLDHFNHFLYELTRSNYGPLAQSTLIASNLTLFNVFYQKNMKNLKNSTKSVKKMLTATSKKKDQIELMDYVSRANDFSFVCSACLTLRRAHSTFLSVFQKDDEFICGQCALDTMKPSDKSIYFLGPILGQFFTSQTKIDQYQKYKIVIPKEQNKCVHILTDYYLYSSQSYSHIFYQFNRPIFYWYKDTDNFDTNFIFKLAQGILVKQINTTELLKHIDKDHCVKLNQVIISNSKEKNQNQPKYAQQSRKLIFAQENITLEKCQNYPTLQCLTCEGIPYYLIVDALNPEIDISSAVKVWRNRQQFQKVSKSNDLTWNLKDMALSEQILQHIQITHALKRLKLNNNKICSMNLFKCETLHQLYLNENNIQKIENFGQFNSLQILEISGNHLQNLENVDTFRELRILIADNNKISLLELNRLQKSLQILSLKNNLIQNIQGQYRNNCLNSLNLQRNKIQAINFQNIKIPTLTQLQLSYNSLHSLTLPNQSFGSLTHLSASFNPDLTQVAISEIKTLENIHIEFCMLQQMILGNPKLVVIRLAKNWLKQIKFTIQMPNLEYITLDYNKLQQLDLSPVGSLQNLTTFSAAYNNLTRINFIPPKNKFKLKSLKLTQNPWPIKFSAAIKRSDAPDLKLLSIGTSNEESSKDINFQLADWLLHSLPQQKEEDFIQFYRREKRKESGEFQRKDIDEIKRGSNFVIEFKNRGADTHLDLFRIVKKYFGEEPKVSIPLKNLVQQKNVGDFLIESSP